MEYRDLIDNVKELGFVPDDAVADAMVKAVLGHLASRMKEEQARQFAAALPEPLNIDKLRGHQINPTTISVDQFIQDIVDQFKLSSDQATMLIEAVMHGVKSGVSPEQFREWEKGLPSEWMEFLESVPR